MTTLFGEVPKEEVVVEPFKQPGISPFQFVNEIHYGKNNLIIDEWSEKQYNPFIINRSLSFGNDTVIQANEMNSRPHLPKPMQNSFLMATIRVRKRFNKWLKKEANAESLETIKEYYGYSYEKAQQVASLLSDAQIVELQKRLFTGGQKSS